MEAGRVLLGTEEISRLPAQERRIGFVFQDQALFPSLDLVDNLTFALKVRGMGRGERERIAGEWMIRAKLDAVADSRVDTLSGGEAQRVAFVRALLWQPSVVFLDEPFSALDRETRKILRKELVELHALWPVPLLLVSHDEEDVAAVATTRLDFAFEGKSRRVFRS
jgi:ABC-type sulfate/molybdate transport systems ATPase subunit